MSKARLERIDQVLHVLDKMGGKASYAYLKDAIVRTTSVSFITAERYIDEMAAMGKIRSVGAFWVLKKREGDV